jgi:DsbC/DsbD-like thiol-disulfide interchange protein
MKAFIQTAGAWCVALAMLLSGVLPTSHAAAQKPGFVQVELVAEHAAAVPGKPLWIGLLMKHDAGWHTYWKNPGDAGLPTTLAFTLPAGFQTGAIEWPHPQRIAVKQLASYGYEGELLLPLLLFVPKQAKEAVNITARAEWLVCKESCIPESAELTLALPISAGNQAAATSTHVKRFADARAALPRPVEGARATAARGNGRITIDITLPAALKAPGELFLDREDVIEPGPTPQATVMQDRVQWSSVLTANGKQLAAPARLPAVWVPRTPVAGQPRAVRLEVQLIR